MWFFLLQSLNQCTHSPDDFWLFQWIDWFSNPVEIETKENLNFHFQSTHKRLLLKKKDCCNVTRNLSRAEKSGLATKQFVASSCWQGNLTESMCMEKHA